MNPLHLFVDSQFTSPYALSAFVAFVEKGIDFKMSTVDLQALENQTDSYAALSQTQSLPPQRERVGDASTSTDLT